MLTEWGKCVNPGWLCFERREIRQFEVNRYTANEASQCSPA